MNLGQPGFVPTGRKQLANPRGWGFNSSNSAPGRWGRASRSRKACVPGPRDLLCPAGRAPRGARPKVAALLSILSGSGPRRNHPHSRNWGQQTTDSGLRVPPGVARWLSPCSHPTVELSLGAAGELCGSPSEGHGGGCCGGIC